MAKLEIVLPPRASEIDALDVGLITLTQAIEQIEPDLLAHGLLGGQHGYGGHWENDIFLMHPYCWCDREGECPWCTGCGIYKDVCAVCSAGETHAKTCYQVIIQALPNDQQETAAKRLCAERGLPWFGWGWHCDCGAGERDNKRRDSSGCDYHLGKGIFARFAPWTLDHKRSYYDPPNFWHKPSNLRVTWYKWIGRDMRTNRKTSPDELQNIFTECLASVIQAS